MNRPTMGGYQSASKLDVPSDMIYHIAFSRRQKKNVPGGGTTDGAGDGNRKLALETAACPGYVRVLNPPASSLCCYVLPSDGLRELTAGTRSPGDRVRTDRRKGRDAEGKCMSASSVHPSHHPALAAGFLLLRRRCLKAGLAGWPGCRPGSWYHTMIGHPTTAKREKDGQSPPATASLSHPCPFQRSHVSRTALRPRFLFGLGLCCCFSGAALTVVRQSPAIMEDAGICMGCIGTLCALST